jgi:hypothetical protein
MKRHLRRAFVVTWIALGLAGALDHTIAERVLGHKIDLVLPHLQFGYVMFNNNPRRVPVFTYARADGVRHELVDLEPRPAWGYARARVAIDAMYTPVYVRDLCNRALRGLGDAITIYVDGYQVDVDRDHPAFTSTVTCDARAPR